MQQLPITTESIQKAIHIIEANPDLKKGRESVEYDLVYKGESYPPILVLSEAHKYLGGGPLTLKDFNNSTSIAFKILAEKGFVVEKKSTLNLHPPRFWVEKTNVTGRRDREIGERALGKALWSPQRDKGGADIYKSMRLVKEGDIIIHLIDNEKISGISRVKKQAVETTGLLGTQWEGPAYLIELDDYTKLDPAINRAEILVEKNRSLLKNISEKSEVFYNRQLDLRQGAYLTPCPVELLQLLNETYKTTTSKNLPLIEHSNFEGQTGEDFFQDLNIIKMKQFNYFLSIKTKPFILLAGLSGTGKSRLVRTLAYQFNNIELDKISQKHPPSNFQLIKVKPNWHDSSDLLGYESRISGKERFIVTDFVRFIVKAWVHQDTPFFLCLDEMNLASVEQYFAEYLSVIETRRVDVNGKIRTDTLISKSLINKYSDKADGVDTNFNLWNELQLTSTSVQEDLKENGLRVPSNLIVMGTVNMDETTHSFSRKVLDRAMTIEMSDINLREGLNEDADEWKYSDPPLKSELILSQKTQGREVYVELGNTGPEIINYLELINEKLEGSPFKVAYRVRDEFLLYAFNYSLLNNKPNGWEHQVLDEMTMMKILPRIEGDEEQTRCLIDLIVLFENKAFSKSLKKAIQMEERRKLYHYTSFWT